MRPVTESDFWRKVLLGDGCWEWQGARQHFGHGWATVPGAPQTRDQAHRIAWRLTNGPIPDGLCVLHSCDNPPCCNPAHLFLGTKRDNAQDAAAKGRMGRHVAARTHCKLGHPLDYRAPDGRRGCLTCRRRQAAESRARSEEPGRREALERLGRAVSA